MCVKIFMGQLGLVNISLELSWLINDLRICTMNDLFHLYK